MDVSSFRSHSKAVVQIAAVAHCSTFQLAKDFIRPMAGRSRRQLWAVLLVSVAVIAQVTVAAFFAPNRFLGTCLTEAWVEAKEIELNISASARDPSTKQLLYPFLHAALPGPRYTLLDSRTFNSSAYTPTCIPSSEQIFGPDAEVDPNTGTVISVGHVAGSVVLEINEGAVHRLNTMIFAIIASELIGYNVSIYYAPASMTLEKRLSLTDPQALCTPVHANVAVSNKLSMSKHGWAVLGDLGNRIIGGIYTPQNFILDGEIGTSFPEKFDADFWRDYIRSDVLIGELAESTLRNNSRYFPPNAVYCKDGVYGCRHHCSKNYACTLREEVHGKECLVIVATQSSATRAYYPAMIANLGIPAYICYIGRTGLQSFALDMLAQRRGVLFYMDYPDEFHFKFPDTFKRVLMPKGSAADIAMSTGTFGENGYGEPTSNPVRVDPFEYTMDKVTSYNILSDSGNAPLRDVFTRIRLPDTDLENILTRYVTLTNTSTQQSEDPHFDAACSWIRDNYDTWTDWMLNPLPLCAVANHMSYFISGCTEDSPSREISFGWTVPDPTNNTSPFDCDGGQMVLPSSLQTSRSCEWLENNNETWLDWIAEQPMCDSTFFSYTVGECTANNKRQISFYWLLPMPSNETTSLECEGELPADVEVDCEYVSTRSPMYFAIAVITSLLGGVTAMSFVEVFRHRDVPIIRRSQYEFLLTMLLGCLLVCCAILLYAGEPTDSLCGARPVIISTGFTLVFGSLIVKTLRVYRIFNSKRLKRVVLPIYVMFKILAGFLFIDTAVLTVWFAIDFPSAVQSTVELTNIAASVSISQITCSSSHFIFSGLLIFWKAILLTAGLYLSFLVRKVSVDFQESIWIFASTVVVATACFMILPLAYLVPLPAATFYVFFAAVLWLATLSVGALMLVPKVLRHREVASNTSASSTSSGDTNDNTGGHKKEQGLTLSTSKRPSPLDQPGPRVASLGHNAARVTPLHEILAVSPCRKKSLGKRTATQSKQAQYNIVDDFAAMYCWMVQSSTLFVANFTVPSNSQLRQHSNLWSYIPPNAPMVQSSEEHAKTRNRRERQALGISISSSVLAAHGAEVKSSQSEFTITDLLTQSSNSKQKQFKKQNHERGMLSSVSVPALSPIRAAIEGPETTSNTKEVSTSSMIANDTPNSKIKPPEGFLSKLQPPENVELFAYSSALCHRLTGRYLPTKLIQQNPGAQQEEIARIQRHPKLVKAIDTIQVLSTQFKEVARETVGHRKELGHTLFRIEESYLKLFESLLEISLGMYWNYEQTSNAERAADKATIAHWQEMYGWKVAECKKLTQRLEAKEIFCRTQKVEIDDIKKQLEDLEDQVKDHRSLESRVLNLMDIETELRAKEREIQAELRELQQRYTEMIEYSRVQLEETRAQQKRIVEELKKSLREKEKTILKQDAAIRELSEKPEPVEYCTRTSQTEVDDDGLWDVQDGIPRFVSKTVLHRMMWRRFNAFVTCKNCGGRPLPRVGRGSCMNGQSAQKELDSSEIDSLAHQFVDIWSVSRAEKVSKKRTRRFEGIEQQWELPAPVLLFLSNLPKSVMAFPFYSVEQVITQIEQIYDDKFISDQVDEADGVAQEELPKFICEYFLKLNELRQSAEIALYRFLVSAKCTYLRNTHIHLFARFANLLRNERSSSNSDQEPEPPKQNQPTQSGSGNQNVGTHYLDRSFLRVFLAARHYLLRKPPASASPKRSKKTKSDLSASKKPQIRELPHIIQVDGLKKWVPLDHAIAIVKWYLSYLPDDEVVAYCRQVEYSTALYIGGAITEVSGNRLAVRAEMRRAMLINGAEASSVDSNRHTEAGESNRSHVNPIIVADVHKVLLLLMTALEQRQALMAKDLVDLFDKGDINHDRVLSLTEFTSIIRTRVPHFSDRRVLRMFREALMGGEDQSFALSMGAFVQVCSDHGLVSLLPDDRMRDPFQRSVPSVVASGATGKTLASALDALTDPKRARLLVSLTETRESNLAVTKESLADPQDIPEELPVSACIDFGVESSTSARAEEVSDDEGVDWEW